MVFLRDYLLSITNEDNQQLFISAEKGSGKHEKDIFVIYQPQIKNKVHKQIHTTYYYYFSNITTSAPPLKQPFNNEYVKSMQEFINPMIVTKAALKINNFYKKYPSYTIVAGTKPSQVNQNEQNEKQNKNKPSLNTEINNEMIMVL